MEDGKCKKQFPKEFNDMKKTNEDGYPLYRRRSTVTATVRGVLMDNRHVVPHSPYLLLKYNAHINVEICTSLKAIKYIYKYFFKGFDCADIAIRSDGEKELCYNEITNYIEARYISAPEAMWRLLELKMHDRSHTVHRLPIHLPNKQLIIFEKGHEEEAVLAATTGRTKLESWFELNKTDEEARQYLYVDIPYHYVYNKATWKPRKKESGKIVSRMYTVSFKDDERFYLRLLLLHVRGATCFEAVRTFDGVVYETFKEAVTARGLLESDTEWDRCLHEASTYKMSKQLRETFAYICCFCGPSQPIELWNKYVTDFALDYMRSFDDDVAINMALHDINSILKQHGLSCSQIGLPTPTDVVSEVQNYPPIEEAREGEERRRILNEKQLDAFQRIISAIDNQNVENHCFYLDGPGGSGKTFLYTTLMAFLRGRGQSVLPYATTGIAATLLKGGRIVHSGFKLPVPLTDTSVSSMRPNSVDADLLRQASLIIIDEITMLPKHGLRCIDRLLREIMNNDEPFGGTFFVVGGDFRQTLPVVMRSTRADIIECCIKSSTLWRYFLQLSLTTNMRSEGQNEHNEWLLRVGNRSLEPIPGLGCNDTIEIPQSLIVVNSIIESIFGSNISLLTVNELSKRVIVAPTNEETLKMNEKIIELLPGISAVYYSAGSIMSEDPTDAANYPVEFLNDKTPSGMPPHILILKRGAIIMLLRNLNPKKGLCNGTRMIVRDLQRNFITAEIISECNRGDIVFIPRIDLEPCDTNLPFVLRRRQFPIIPAFVITINKSQGQTFDHVVVNLKTAVFSHGQLYVALTRSRYPTHLKVRIQPNPQQGPLL